MEADKECPVCLEYKPCSEFYKLPCCSVNICKKCLIEWIGRGKEICPVCAKSQNISYKEHMERLKTQSIRSDVKTVFEARYTIIGNLYKKIIVMIRLLNLLKPGENLSPKIITEIERLISECNIFLRMDNFVGETPGCRINVEKLVTNWTNILNNYFLGHPLDDTVIKFAKECNLKEMSAKNKKKMKKSQRKSRRKL